MANYKFLKYFFITILFLFFSLCLHSCSFTQNRLGNQQVIVVAIASSLSDVMGDIRKEFLSENLDFKIIFNTASSGVLAQQIQQDAPIDIFASADLDLIQRLVTVEKIPSQSKKIFAQNKLVLATSKSSQITVSSLEDLASPTIQKIALGNPKSVPAGKYAQNALGRSPSGEGLYQKLQEENKLVFGENVRQVLTYLENQVADVGFIYQTDLQQSQQVKPLLVLDQTLTGEINYAIAIVNQTSKKQAAQHFIDFILSAKGQRIIEEYGFLSIRD